MRKRFISVCIVMLLACGIYGCARTAKDTPGAEAETVKTENTEAKSEEELDAKDALNSVSEVEESAEPEDALEPEDDAENDLEKAIYQQRYEEFQERISEARDYIAGKLPDTDISDEELPEGVCLMDICEGDLDGDDKQDFAVVLEYELGYEYFSGGEFGLPQEWITTDLCVYLC